MKSAEERLEALCSSHSEAVAAAARGVREVACLVQEGRNKTQALEDSLRKEFSAEMAALMVKYNAEFMEDDYGNLPTAVIKLPNLFNVNIRATDLEIRIDLENPS